MKEKDSLFTHNLLNYKLVLFSIKYTKKSAF